MKVYFAQCEDANRTKPTPIGAEAERLVFKVINHLKFLSLVTFSVKPKETVGGCADRVPAPKRGQQLARPQRYHCVARASCISQHLSIHVCWNPAHAERAASAYRTDIYRAALAPMGIDLPPTDMKVEGALEMSQPIGSTGGTLRLGPDGFFDLLKFDPNRIEAYISGQRQFA